MRYKEFLYATIGLVSLSGIALADDSVANFSLRPVQQNKDIALHQQQFFPLKPGNLSMSSRPLVRMSPQAAQPISMSKSPQPIAASIKIPLPPNQQVVAEAGFEPVLKSKTGGSAMSKEQAQQIISLFSSAE